MKRGELETKDFHYNLPDERIAKYPLPDRNNSKLLVYKGGDIREDVFSNLGQYLPAKSLLVFNDTKVLAARLHFKKVTGSSIEIFCLEPYESTVEQALNTTNTSVWQCMVGNLRKFPKDAKLELNIADTILKASIYQKRENDLLIRFEWEGGIPFSSILDAAGEVPLPPYLNRDTEEEDKNNYQTVYAKNKGAVAAPTAGLHFVPNQLIQLQEKGHKLEFLTLYVGAGTFKIVKADKLVDHVMHKERIVIGKEVIENLVKHDGAIISVGTTSSRSLESLYWLAAKMHEQKSDKFLDITQDDAYQVSSEWPFKQACEFLVEYLNKNGLQEVDFHSSLFILPSYDWKAIDGLITNFHQPGSTLMALVSSFIGDSWKTVYNYALENGFRFLSYGDSSLLMR